MAIYSCLAVRWGFGTETAVGVVCWEGSGLWSWIAENGSREYEVALIFLVFSNLVWFNLLYDYHENRLSEKNGSLDSKILTPN